MSMVLGLVGYLSLLVAVAVAMTTAARITARALGIARFRWFTEPEAPVSGLRLALVRVAAALAPWLVSFMLFWASILLGGIGTTAPGAWVDVMQGQPAQVAGLRDGDRVAKVDGYAVESFDAMRSAIQRKAGPSLFGGTRHLAQMIELEVERAGQRQVFAVAPRDGRIGVRVHLERPGVVGAAVRASTMPWAVVHETVGGLLLSFSGRRRATLGGPVAIVTEASKAHESADLAQLLAGLAAWFWPFLAGMGAFDWCSSLLFRRLHPEATRSQAKGYRLERLRQALLLVLASCVVLLGASLLFALGVKDGIVLVLPATFVAPAFYPLTWIIGAQVWRRSSVVICMLLSLFLPCALPLVGYELLRQLRKALEAEGLRVRGFRTSFENVGT